MLAQIWRILPLLMLVALLASCAAAPAPAPASTPIPALHILADPAPLLVVLPPMLAVGDGVAPPAPADPAALAAWAQPIARWQEQARRAAQLDGLAPAAAQAELATLAAALQDGLTLAAHARAQGRAVADDAVLAEVAWRLIAHAHPLRADAARADAETAAWVACWRDAESPPAVLTGRLLGAAVAQAVIATLDAPVAP